jgi:replicative DNA helicase
MKAKLPPHDIETERSVLGAVLIDTEAIIKVSEILKPEDFYAKEHKLIYEAMDALYEKREPIDVVTLTGQLKKMKSLSEVGGASAIAKLSNILSTASNVESYANLVREHSIKRNLISLSAEMSDLAFDESKNTKDILDMAEQKVLAVSQTTSQKGFIPIKDTLVESFDRLDELQRNGGELRGIPTGFSDLDGVLAGLQKSNLIILAARPGMGKTAFALNIAQNAAVLAKKRIGFFSLEMSKEELVDRLLVSQANIDAWRLKTGRLDQQDFLKLSDAMGVLAEAHIFIDDTPGLSIYEMRTKARRLMIEHQVDLLVVDYLQLAHGKTMDNRVQEVAEISQGLKNIARELRIPVIALSQLSRAIESRGEKNPQLSDLRESGCLSGETLILMSKTGNYERIDNLIEKVGEEVLALNQKTYKLESKKIINAFCTGEKITFKMTTQLGREIKATANHKFLAIDGWKRLDELEVGGKLAVPSENNVDIYWDTIVSVEQLSKEKVYDLTIEDHSNFVANNIVVHNSIEQDADVVMFLYRKDEDIRESVSLKIAKHRNGAVGEIELFFRGDRIKFFGMEKRMDQ